MCGLTASTTNQWRSRWGIHMGMSVVLTLLCERLLRKGAGYGLQRWGVSGRWQTPGV